VLKTCLVLALLQGLQRDDLAAKVIRGFTAFLFDILCLPWGDTRTPVSTPPAAPFGKSFACPIDTLYSRIWDAVEYAAFE